MTSSHSTVHVALGERSYDIVIGSGTIDELGSHLIHRAGRVPHAVVITDSNLAESHGRRVAESLSSHIRRVDSLVVPAGEPSKSVSEVERLWNELLRLGSDRATHIVAVGGGVIGDLAGFAAAGFARGLPFVQVPTTLLAQVDSSVGGKVGVNLPAAKNMVGAFWQPRFVLIDTQTLGTLPQRELLAGLAEVVKYGVILDADFFAYLEAHVAQLLQRDESVLAEVVARCCRLKADVVAADERETTGLRAVLNYGHTFGHAVEATTHYGTYLHGEAVAIGMHCAARLAVALGRVPPEFAERQARLLAALGLPLRAEGLAPQSLLAAMRHDKKAAEGRLRFILPSRLGQVELVADIPEDQVLRILDDLA